MAKKMLIDATHAEETRVVVADGNKVEEFDFETINKRQLAGNIYLAKVTRVEPSLQAAFVDYGGNRHGFLAFAEIHPDYYQIPLADRQAILEEETALAKAEEEEDEKPTRSRRRRSSRRDKDSNTTKPEVAAEDQPQAAEDAVDAVTPVAAQAERAADTDDVVRSEDIPGMGVLDDGDDNDHAVGELSAPLGTPDVAAVEAADHGDETHNDTDEDAAETGPSDERAAEEGIESVADEDVTEEIRRPRKPRARRFKIQEVIKVRQILLVQVVKEERGNKGAALTTYLSLAGRYCVLMPNTARGGGISRKITQAADRKKLKEIAAELEVPQGAGLIIRTAGAQRTKTEIRRDYEYLMRMWEQIRTLTMKSVAPAPIYEEGDLIKRSIRDLYSKDIDEVLVEGERGYRAAKDFMKMIMPSHAKNVQHYNEQLPLFARYQVESYLGQMFNPVVQLRSGGYIVIGVTEALVAVDVNSGRATKEGSIEDTAVKTNLEAAEEVARQLRLRDLAGLIVIDFIDMEERKNNAAVEKRMKDKLKTDRARIQVGRISGFGLMEMSRQRLRPGMIESTTQPCAHCHGTGLIRSDDSLALQVLRAIEEEGTRKRSREVLVKVPVAVANYLMNAKREHVALIEARYGLSVRIEADPTLVSPDFSIEKFKTATRIVPEVAETVVHATAQLMAEIDEAEVVEIDETPEDDDAEPTAAPPAHDEGEDGQPKKKKRRRRRRRKSSGEHTDSESSDEAGSEDDAADTQAEASDVVTAEGAEPAAAEEAPKKTRTRRRRSSKSDAPADVATDAETAATDAEPSTEEQAAEPAEGEAPKKRRRTRRKKTDTVEAAAEQATPVAETASDAAVVAEAVTADVTVSQPEPAVEPAPEPVIVEDVSAPPQSEAPHTDAGPEVAAPVVEAEPAQAPAPQPELQAEVQAEQPTSVAPAAEPGLETAQAEPEPAPEQADKPKRRGWWNAG
ncbi:ribonuclease [Thioclava sp. SK-1]|uniref:ribonuclease E/G n=1 Tax=Thioclava sp. SK-1 TaxID=1889770 RepID=UPI000824C705|nr:ribonuclease E/G [Thioclava sp. SK-1]OCX61159.1 ribonuclease [Thioclava sp. SK-1]